MNTILMSLYTGEHQPSNNPDVTLTADHRNKNNDNMLAKQCIAPPTRKPQANE
uniref:Uncharacterized protein n=1 Tax=Romanomermis culicivorax TaxID=13658 RepID=A0A915K4C5_ROMCU